MLFVYNFVNNTSCFLCVSKMKKNNLFLRYFVSIILLYFIYSRLHIDLVIIFAIINQKYWDRIIEKRKKKEKKRKKREKRERKARKEKEKKKKRE